MVHGPWAADRGQSSDVQASRLAPRGRRSGLHGMVARTESNWLEGWECVFGVVVPRTWGGDGLVVPLTSDFVWASKGAQAPHKLQIGLILVDCSF